MNMNKMILPNGLECHYLSKEETEFIFSEVFTEQQYLRNGIQINEGDCIFDVGANIGLFSLYVSNLQKKVQIYAFEPIKQVFEVLKENVRLHSIPNIYLLNYGLSSTNESEKLFTFYPNMAGNSTSRPHEKLEQQEVMNAALNKQIVEYLFQSNQVKAEVRTLSSVINELGMQSIDLLKIDVEGEEYEVLKGIEQQEWNKIKQIVAEVHDREGRLEQFQKLLISYGFDITVERNNLMPPTVNNFNLYAVRR